LGFIIYFSNEVNHIMMKNLTLSVRLALLLLLAANMSHAQPAKEIQGIPITGAAGITLTMKEIVAGSNAVIRTQSEIRSRPELPTGRRFTAKPLPDALAVNSYPKTGEDGVIAQQNTQAVHSNFTATIQDETPGVLVTPPDCMGEVGLTQVCIASNNRIKWYAKNTVCENPRTTSTTTGSSPAGNPQFSVFIDDFFSSVRAGSETTDPHVHYDRLSQRWFIVCINTSPNSNRILIAVSNGPTITNQSSFTFYQFAHDQGALPGTTDYQLFCDFPTLGVDKNALYIGGMIFDFDAEDFVGSSVYVVRKSSLLSGGPIVFTPFRNVGTDLGGIFCAQGVQNDDPGATSGYFVGVNTANFSQLDYIVVNDPGGSPSIIQNQLSVPTTSFPLNVTAQGGTGDLDGGDDRLLNAVLTTNKLTGAKSIWASHNIKVRSTGVAGSIGDRTAVRWYKLTPSGNTLTLGQAGTLFDPSASALSYWMGSIGASGQDHAVVGATVAGLTKYANSAVAGRYSSTPSTNGGLLAPVEVTNYTEAYNYQNENVQRWGDYSQTVVDPSDDMTLWTFQQFTSAPDRWAVRATQLKAPPPAPVSTMTPITCTNNGVVDVTVNGTATNFAGYFDPGNDAGGPGFEKRLSVTSTGGVVITDVAFNTPTEIAFKLNYAGAPLGSTQTLTITNPDCQSVTYQYNLPTGCVIVPVKWLNVSAQWSNNRALVNWKTANESDLRHYEVERSSDGINFSTLSIVAAKNASSAAYVYTDLTPGNSNYYRIRQVDKDGKFSYSPTALLKKNEIRNMSLFPNPATNQLQVLLSASKGNFRLIDASGQVVYSTQVLSNTLKLNTERYARGIYFAEFAHDNGNIEREKIVLR
jgi:hypothetical protein